MSSPLELLRQLPPSELEPVLKHLEAMQPGAGQMLAEMGRTEWTRLARTEQTEPASDWFCWLIQTGRGWGKTRTGAETIRARIDAGTWRQVVVAGPTTGDVVDYMIEGTAESPGLMGVWPRYQRPEWNRSSRRLRCWNGAVIRYRSAESMDAFRGPNSDGAWADEIDAWKPKGCKPQDLWKQLELGTRTGPDPRIVATSTPKRGRLVQFLQQRGGIVVTRGSTYDNRANLNRAFFDNVVGEYEGTHFAAQEILGELPAAVEGCIVSPEMIDAHRITTDALPPLERTVVGVDPYGGGGDACGIVAVGRNGREGYVLADRTNRHGPDGWGRVVIETALEYEAGTIVYESNYGGNTNEAVIRHAAEAMGARCPRLIGRPATKSKPGRFEPVGAKYEREEMEHVGTFPQLEDEIVCFTPSSYEGGASPNRADALVIAAEELWPARRSVGWDELYPVEGSA